MHWDIGRVHQIPKLMIIDEEHAAFVRGLEALGKGRWSEISEFYVKTR
jgi:hypothetical protein